MTNLLLRLFVKDYQHPEKPKVHTAIGSMAGITGIVCNILLFVMKVIAGILSGAVSVVADALNNLSDAASSVVTLVGFRLAQRPADSDHPYGHARYEYISGLVVAALIFVIGVELAESAIGKIFHPSSVTVSTMTVIILICAAGIKLWMYFFFTKLGKKIRSGTLKAAAIDSRNDVIASGAVLAGCLVEKIFSVPVDGYIGLAVALFILWSGIGVARETVSTLLGQRADEALVNRISDMVLSHEQVLGIHDLLVHDYGPGQCFASVHVEISAQVDPMVCHDIIDAIECNILESLNVHMVIHYDPVMENDAEWQAMGQLMEEILQELDPGLSMHDFRIVRGTIQPKLVFDLAVPYPKRQEHLALKTAIDGALQSRGKDYLTVIRFDNKV